MVSINVNIPDPWDFPTSGKSLNSDDTVTCPPLPVAQGIPIGNNVYYDVYVGKIDVNETNCYLSLVTEFVWY